MIISNRSSRSSNAKEKTKTWRFVVLTVHLLRTTASENFLLAQFMYILLPLKLGEISNPVMLFCPNRETFIFFSDGLGQKFRSVCETHVLTERGAQYVVSKPRNAEKYYSIPIWVWVYSNDVPRNMGHEIRLG